MVRIRNPYAVVSVVVVAVAMVVAATVPLIGQAQFQFVVSATDAEGSPVTDVTTAQVLMSENSVANQIVKVEPYRVPVKLTVAVDNGQLSGDALGHYRAGLTAMIKALPPEIEVTIIATAPQPRMVVRPTLNREQLLRGVNGFAPEQANPRFTDALVEDRSASRSSSKT